jgi:hypothetical protein
VSAVKKIAFLAATMLLTSSAGAANISGKWVIKTSGRGDRTTETALQLSQAGNLSRDRSAS